ncbi:MAG: hypothetical protein WA865_14930, partial [Spirulinaceae cyanobacterium]
MNDRNLLIVVIYLICIIYVFYQVAQSLDKYVGARADQEDINQAIAKKKLGDILDLKFALPNMREMENFRDIGIVIENKSPTRSLAINWQQSTLSNLKGKSQRVIREVPGMKIDLSQPQTFTTVGPSQNVAAKITTETTLKPGANGSLELTKPLFSSEELKSLPEEGGEFTLNLSIQVSGP